MNRRNFVAGASAAPLLSSVSMSAAPAKPSFLELRKFLLRNTTDNQRGRLTDFVSRTYAPALIWAGAGPIGLFSPQVAPDAPFLLLVAAYPSLDAFDLAHTKLLADDAFLKEAEKASSGPLLFQRQEVTLLKGFAGFPGIEVPPVEQGRAPRLFELRTYESDTPLSLKKKIGMFQGGEIDIFRKYGLLPVFFGAQIAGAKMPSLTYMVGFDSSAEREANWRAFGTSPEWKKLASTPGLSDGETVSNITNMLLSPIPGSQIRWQGPCTPAPRSCMRATASEIE